MSEAGFTFHVIRSAGDPLFYDAYAMLDAYFGSRGEMETPDIIEARLAWDPARPSSGFALRYEIVVALALDGTIAAVRDHSVIIDMARVRDEAMPAVVHLSHILVAPRYRGRHLIEALHDFPIDTARETLHAAGLPEATPVVLAAEVEPYQADDRERIRRLQLFKHAGYRPIDPAAVPYVQPDFRPPEVIERSGGARPLPFILLVWRLGREAETRIGSDEVVHIVMALYEMYGRSMRAEDMQVAYASLDRFPPAGTEIALTWDRVHPDLAAA